MPIIDNQDKHPFYKNALCLSLIAYALVIVILSFQYYLPFVCGMLLRAMKVILALCLFISLCIYIVKAICNSVRGNE